MQEAENARVIEEQRAVYLPNLMIALENAAQFEYTISVRNGSFVVVVPKRVQSWRESYTLSSVYSSADWIELCQLEHVIKQHVIEAAEEQRKDEARKVALSKLSVEERELLGV